MDGYSYAMREAVSVDMRQENERLRAQALRLAQEKRALEQLVKDFSVFVSRREVAYDEIRESARQSLQARAKALLEQEVK